MIAVSLGEWQEAYRKASHFVSQLSTAQKIQLITGNDVNTTDDTFKALQFLDGSMGLQDYFYASAFSQSSALAMTWDREAMYDQARAVATEFYLKGIQVVNGPTTQPMGRTVWGGRLVETFGPDPYLNGIVTGLSTKAYVDTGVIAGAKHYILNEQETNRTSGGGGPGGAGGAPGGMGASNSSSSSMPPSKRASGDSNSSSSSAPYSSNADDKTLHETYLWSFYDGVKNGLGAVMCAMTKVKLGHPA